MHQESYHTSIRKEGDTFYAEFPHLGDFNNVSAREFSEMVSILKTWAAEHDINPTVSPFKIKFGEEEIPVTMH